MKTTKVTHELSTPEKRIEIQRLVRTYPGKGKGGRISWKEAFDSEPDLKAKLGIHDQKSQQRVYQLSSDMYRKSAQNQDATKNGNGTAHAPANTPAPLVPLTEEAAAEKPNRVLITPEKEAVIREIKANFSTPKRLLWKQAFDAHPEWKEVLGYSGNKADIHRMTYLANRVLGKTGAGAKSKRKPKTPPAPDETQPQQMQPVVMGCRFCPNCGHTLELHNQAELATFNLQQQQR